MTIGEAKETIRRYLLFSEGLKDFYVSEKELKEAMQCIASGDFLSDNMKDHPNAKVIRVTQDLDLYYEKDKEHAIDYMKQSLAHRIAEMLLGDNIIEFNHTEEEFYDVLKHRMTAKLVAIKKEKD